MNFIEKIKKLQNYFQLGYFKNVIEGCTKLNKKFPNNSFILNLTGMAYQGLLNHHKAIYFFELSIKADNSNIAAMNNMANSLKNIGEFVKADQIFKKIISIDSNYINALNNYANLKTEVNDFEGAIELYKRTILTAKKNKIDIKNFLLHLAKAYQSLNNKTETINVLNEILEINPEDINAHKTLNSIYKYSHENKETINHISVMDNIFTKDNLSEDQKLVISFALGKAYDDLKDNKKAIKYLSLGNQLKRKIIKSNLDQEIKVMNDTKNLFKDINLKVSHNNISQKKIIFICGMPRSGTTLIEQIIASHKKVYGAGEPSFMTSVIYNNFLNENKFDKKKLIKYQNSSNNLISDQYLENYSLYDIKQNVITDKATFNFKWIGFIKIFFPNSKIIHCKRNPEDNCLSIYKNSFASSQMNWSYDQMDISNYYNGYSSLMNFWHSKIPEFIYTIDYEKIVSDKKNEIKDLLKFCELDWDDDCLNHHKNNKTPIRSVSISQARQPVYNSSVNSSDSYKDHLKEMFDNLI